MIKESFLEMAKRHKAGDMLVQGDYQTCSVGCFNRDYGNDLNDFKALAGSTGYREWTHHIQEAIFEGLPEDDAKNWHVRFAEKMETVKDFDALYHSFMVGVLKIALPHDKNGVVQPVIDLHENYKDVTSEDWEKAKLETNAAEAEAWTGPVTLSESYSWSADAVIHAAIHATNEAMSADEVARNTVEAVAKAGDPSEYYSDEVFFVAWQEISDVFLNAKGGE
jgi:hypothetical protein